MHYGYIYIIKIPATPDMFYIGQTTVNVEKRHGQHCRPKLATLIGRAIQAYGDSTVDVLKEASTQEELDNLEIGLIKSMNTIYPNGYNLHEGGQGNRRAYSGEKEVYWDDEVEAENGILLIEGPALKRSNHEESVLVKRVGNILFKHQAINTRNEFIEHVDSSIMKGKLYIKNKTRGHYAGFVSLHPTIDWVTYLNKIYGDQYKEVNRGQKDWLEIRRFVSHEERDTLIKTICEDFTTYGELTVPRTVS